MRKFYLMAAAVMSLLATDIVISSPADAQGFCRELRNACLFGPRGLGSCQRYRDSGCDERRGERIREREGRDRDGGGRCERLRRACEMKDRLGEQGQGNCRRFRDECGGRR